MYDLEQRANGLKKDLDSKNSLIQEYEKRINDDASKIRDAEHSLAEYTNRMVIMSK
jgi:hypothetical protein